MPVTTTREAIPAILVESPRFPGFPDAIMQPMQRSTQEIEVKLAFDSAAEALRRLGDLGAVECRPRQHEDNVVFDRESDPLRPAGKLLRLRRSGDAALLTFKRRIRPDDRHKVSEEHETFVDDARALTAVLGGLGFSPAYRYEKFRTQFALDGLSICLDETPIGCFVELEGPPERIDAAAGALGFTPRDYVRSTYLELHARAIERGEVPPGDLVFRGGEVPRAR
jgi:adenylate cyclase class 2